MILADLGPVLLIGLGALPGFVFGVALGRVDWNQRVSYWQQRALFKCCPGPPPSATPAEPAPSKTDTRTEAA